MKVKAFRKKLLINSLRVLLRRREAKWVDAQFFSFLPEALKKKVEKMRKEEQAIKVFKRSPLWQKRKQLKKS